MFKTSQPNPDRSKNADHSTNESVENKRPSRNVPNSEFETLVDFSKWIDEQLLNLESNHEQFFTSESVRNFFKRN
jgi:hypothetical protein